MNRNIWMPIIGFVAISGAFFAYSLVNPQNPEATPADGYEIINTYPHDSGAFTQGLVFIDGELYEGTGLYGQSSLRRVDLETGDILQEYNLPDNYFGEGVTVYGDKIIQLTWTSNIGFVYNRDNFDILQEFSYPTQGWGLTHDGEQLIMSDGTSTLYFLDPENFEEVDTIEVRDNAGNLVTRLNELEYINGEIYANIWQTDYIARISPQTEKVAGWIHLKGLLTPEEEASADVLNGIAYDAARDRLFVTGKYWPKLFEIRPVQHDSEN